MEPSLSQHKGGEAPVLRTSIFKLSIRKVICKFNKNRMYVETSLIGEEESESCVLKRVNRLPFKVRRNFYPMHHQTAQPWIETTVGHKQAMLLSINHTVSQKYQIVQA